MPRHRLFVPFVPLLFGVILALVPGSARAAGVCEPDGIQPSGAVYRICMPETWNGSLVLFAHGYVAFNEPVAIPEDQLVLADGTSVPGIINALGFAFATTSYATNGLAVKEGIADLVELVGIFARGHGVARRVFLVGPSEGGLITALAIERHPETFDGGVAACGPIGNFKRQTDYLGDFRVIFDHFFPNVIPGSPIDVPPDVIDGFYDLYVDRILEAVRADPGAAAQLLSVTRAPVDPQAPATVEDTILGLSWYDVFATNDATEKLGGGPYGNRMRYYLGSDRDLLLNLTVPRFDADPEALAAIESGYQTSGRLSRSLVTLHTTGDPIIPYWHEPMYRLKVLAAGAGDRHMNIRVDRYGHCTFKAGEVLLAFAVMLFRAAGQPLRGVEAVLQDPVDLQQFRELSLRYGVVPR